MTEIEGVAVEPAPEYYAPSPEPSPDAAPPPEAQAAPPEEIQGEFVNTMV